MKPDRTDKLIRIGVIADTHGLFDPAIIRHFKGVDHIIHAGDIGSRSVIERLEKIAPVTAVSGNVDEFEKSGWPRESLFTYDGLRIAVRHMLYERGRLTKDAEAWLNHTRPAVCIFGHSHRPTIGRYGQTVLFNPGSAGPQRFSLPRGIGILTISRKKILPRLVRLGDKEDGSRKVYQRKEEDQ
ncbi:MAG TPA: metallophosphoesterase family protein [Nitrospira sp.]